jgi:hypothetical protein
VAAALKAGLALGSSLSNVLLRSGQPRCDHASRFAQLISVSSQRYDQVFQSCMGPRHAAAMARFGRTARAAILNCGRGPGRARSGVCTACPRKTLDISTPHECIRVCCGLHDRVQVRDLSRRGQSCPELSTSGCLAQMSKLEPHSVFLTTRSVL